jgi:kynurenine 3-monooxygenase
LVTKELVNVEADLIVGCDGAYSSVRASLLKDKPVDFSQSYISSYYLELQIPAGPNGEYLMPPNHLHIWPRGDFMMIALPNQDHTFTCTLFMPLNMFEAIKNEDDLMRFFEENFKDSIDLIGK